MKKLLSILSLLTCSSLLMSATNLSQIQSGLINKPIPAIKCLSSGKRVLTAYGNKTSEIAATLTFSYELFQMDKTTEVFTEYVPVYTLLYELKIYLNDYLHYKGGVGNWFNGYNPTYLDDISITAHFSGSSNVCKATQTPKEGEKSKVKMLLNVYPENGVGTAEENTAHTFKAGTTSFGLNSESYYYSLLDASKGIINVDYNFVDDTDRIAAYIENFLTVNKDNTGLDFKIN